MNESATSGELLRAANVSVRVGFPPFVASLLARNVIAITFGSRIWIHPRVLESAPDLLDAIVRHEIVHVMQYRRDGVVRFLIRYLFEYVRGRGAGLDHYEAYAAISYEREAYRVEIDPVGEGIEIGSD